MKKKNIILCLSALLVVSLIATGCGKKAELKDGAEVAVSTKDGKISATEYYNKIKQQNISQLVDMIDHQILDEKYPKNEEEDKAVSEQITQMKSSYQGNEETFKSVIQQYFGVSSEEELDKMLRLEYKRNLAVKDYIKTHLTDKEIQTYYDENIIGDIKASHILIKVDVKEDATDDEKKKAEEKALKEAKDIIKKLDDGKKFADLAKEYSDDTSSAKSGGELGYFKSDDMVAEFTDAAKKLEKGKYSKEPVKTEFGYHIILKEDQKEKAKLKDVKDEIKTKLTESKLSSDSSMHYQTLIKIREDKKITWKDDELKKQYNELMDQLIENAKKKTSETQ